MNLSLFSLELGKCCNCGTQDSLINYMSCECAKESRGEIAYKEGGILKDHFLRQGGDNSSGCKRKNKIYSHDFAKIDVERRCSALCGKCGSRRFIRESSVRCRCHNECGNCIVQ